jgi:two-component system sensor histidine kinase/response regulator
MDNGFYCLIIRDHGVGMDQTHLKEIGAYRQFNRELQEQQGYGLGLAITRRITELYGGTFSIESEVGKGTTVTIRLPLPAGI